jgi:hypothetical protein
MRIVYAHELGPILRNETNHARVMRITNAHPFLLIFAKRNQFSCHRHLWLQASKHPERHADAFSADTVTGSLEDVR